MQIRFFARRLRAFARDRRANVAMVFALLAIPLTLATGMGIDYTNAARIRSKLNAAADAAALSAVNSSAMLLTNSQAQALATNLFNANAAAIPSLIYNSSSGLTVTIASPNALTRTATISYTAASKNYFAGILGMQSIAVQGHSSASSAASPSINFYLLLDNSSSMALPATQAGITQMQSLTPKQNPGGCAFACHEVNPNVAELGSLQAAGNPCVAGTSGFNCPVIDNFQLAKNNGIMLRFDELNNAVGTLISTASNLQGSIATPPTYQFAVYSINGQFQTGLTNIMPMTSKYASAWSNDSSNFVLHEVYSYDQGCANASCTSGAFATLDEVHWNGVGYFDSNLSDALNTLANGNSTVSALPTAGTGSPNSTPQEILFFVTDGVEDFVPSGSQNQNLQISALGQTGLNACTTLKNRGVQIAILYTTYFPTPGFFLYNDYVSSIQSQISANLQSCASTGLFQAVAPGEDLGSALTALFQSATASAHLTH